MKKHISNERGEMVEYIIILSLVIMFLTILFPRVKDIVLNMGEQIEETIVTTDTIKEPMIQKTQEEIQAEKEQARKTMKILAGVMLLIGTLIALSFGIYQLVDYLKEKDKKKDLLAIMKDINRRGIKKSFELERKNSSQHIYHFEKNNYRFTVETNQQLISCRVKKENKKNAILYFVFNSHSHVFEIKNVSSKQIKNYQTDIGVIESFIEKVVTYDWNIKHGINITNEEDIEMKVKEIKEQVPKTETKTLRDELNKLENLMREKGENKIADRLGEMIVSFELLNPHLDTMGIEVNHVINYSLINDLHKLIEVYNELDSENKENYLEKVAQSVEKMENKIEAIYEKTKENKEKEIEKMLLVIEKKYEEKQAL